MCCYVLMMCNGRCIASLSFIYLPRERERERERESGGHTQVRRDEEMYDVLMQHCLRFLLLFADTNICRSFSFVLGERQSTTPSSGTTSFLYIYTIHSFVLKRYWKEMFIWFGGKKRGWQRVVEERLSLGIGIWLRDLSFLTKITRGVFVWVAF